MFPLMATTAERGPGRAKKKGSGRVTQAGQAGSLQSDRYTPPIPKSVRTSPRWMGFLIIALFVLGVLTIILDYANALPGGVNNIYLVVAIGLILAGLIVATRYH